MEFDVLALRHDGDESQLEELPVTSLAEFAPLSLADLTAEIAAMQKTFTPVSAGTFSTVTRSRQDDPSPADTAARGELIEELA